MLIEARGYRVIRAFKLAPYRGVCLVLVFEVRGYRVNRTIYVVPQPIVGLWLLRIRGVAYIATNLVPFARVISVPAIEVRGIAVIPRLIWGHIRVWVGVIEATG